VVKCLGLAKNLSWHRGRWWEQPQAIDTFAIIGSLPRDEQHLQLQYAIVLKTHWLWVRTRINNKHVGLPLLLRKEIQPTGSVHYFACLTWSSNAVFDLIGLVRWALCWNCSFTYSLFRHFICSFLPKQVSLTFSSIEAVMPWRTLPRTSSLPCQLEWPTFSRSVRGRTPSRPTLRIWGSKPKSRMERPETALNPLYRKSPGIVLNLSQ